MKISRWDLRAAFRYVTDVYYLEFEGLKDNLSEKQFFYEMWDLMNTYFTIYVSGDYLRITCKSEVHVLKFLTLFMMLNSEIDLEFNINYERNANMVILPKEGINNAKLISLMDLLYWQVCPMPRNVSQFSNSTNE